MPHALSSRARAPPDAADVAALAFCWKRYYNTPAGAGTEAEFAENWRRQVAA